MASTDLGLKSDFLRIFLMGPRQTMPCAIYRMRLILVHNEVNAKNALAFYFLIAAIIEGQQFIVAEAPLHLQSLRHC